MSGRVGFGRVRFGLTSFESQVEYTSGHSSRVSFARSTQMSDTIYLNIRKDKVTKQN